MVERFIFQLQYFFIEEILTDALETAQSIKINKIVKYFSIAMGTE